MTEVEVSGCKGCPFRGSGTTDATCRHTGAEWPTLCYDAGTPAKCPMLRGPVTLGHTSAKCPECGTNGYYGGLGVGHKLHAMGCSSLGSSNPTELMIRRR